MKKLTFIILVLFTGNATYAQATTDKSATSSHGKTVSAAAHTSVSADASVDAASKGEYVSQVARSKKDEASKEAKEVAKEAKAQAKQVKQEQKEAAKANLQELSDTEAAVSSTAQINQETSLEESALTSDGSAGLFATVQGKGQDKAKSDKKDAPKDKTTDKTSKELDNHGQKVKAAAQGIVDGTAKKGQEVKEVASAKRQAKPEKVEAGVDVDVEVKAPKSAARPGRGAARAVQGTTTAATKTVGNAAKAVKPVKVGGKVGVGSVIKVGKN